ncbi:MAG: hypothetical protein ACH350_08435 [Parachlamydiaceae bacterium]
MTQHDANALKQNMMDTCYSIWKHADEVKRSYIKSIWATIMEPTELLSWRLVKDTHEYELELNHEMSGIHPDIYLGELIIDKKIRTVFSEEKIAESGRYRQIISFPDKGISIRIRMGWFSKDHLLKRIFIEDDDQGLISCSVDLFGQSVARSAEQTLAFWQQVSWRVM